MNSSSQVTARGGSRVTLKNLSCLIFDERWSYDVLSERWSYDVLSVK